MKSGMVNEISEKQKCKVWYIATKDLQTSFSFHASTVSEMIIQLVTELQYIPNTPLGPLSPGSPLGPGSPFMPSLPFDPFSPGGPLGPGIPSLHWQLSSDCLRAMSWALAVISVP